VADRAASSFGNRRLWSTRRSRRTG
jgi:hypothetical protein